MSNDPAVIAAWQERKRERQERFRDERQFRDEVRTFMGQQGEATKGMREDITALRVEMLAHEQRDRERFDAAEQRHDELKKKVGGHNQIISRRNDNWKLVFGVLTATAAVLGILWTIIKGG